MKKPLVAIVASLLLLALVGCSSTALDPTVTPAIVGTWQAGSPLPFVKTFNADGTYTDTLSTIKESGTWTLVDTALTLTPAAGSAVTVTVDFSDAGDHMYLTDAGMTTTYSKL